jgi:hypothetical protein
MLTRIPTYLWMFLNLPWGRSIKNKLKGVGLEQRKEVCEEIMTRMYTESVKISKKAKDQGLRWIRLLHLKS